MDISDIQGRGNWLMEHYQQKWDLHCITHCALLQNLKSEILCQMQLLSFEEESWTPLFDFSGLEQEMRTIKRKFSG